VTVSWSEPSYHSPLDSMTLLDGDVGELPRRRWPAGAVPLMLRLPGAGLVLGMDRHNTAVAVPVFGPDQCRVGIVGDLGLAQFVALRLLGAACELTVVTGRPQAWAAVRAAAAETPFIVTDRIARWPSEGSRAPRALLVDMPEAPTAGFGRAPWSTVLHLASEAPAASVWWQSTHVVLAAPGSQSSVAALRPRVDVGELDRMRTQEVAAIEGNDVMVFVPLPSAAERNVLDGTGRSF